jgi:hypothetical protein
VNEGAAAPEGSTPAASSPADDDGAQPASLLDVVQDAVKKPEGEAESPTAEAQGEAQPGEAEGEGDKPKSEEDQAAADAKLPFHEHPRWKEVIAERDSFREDAGRFRQVSSFMERHGLSAEEVGEGFDVMAKLKSGDPAAMEEARAYFERGLAQLNAALGAVLPDDLREKVENGLIDEDTAKEVAQARATAALRTKQVESRDAAETQAEQQRELTARAQAMATAVDAEEQRLKASDPDYAKKAELVRTTCLAIVHETGKKPATEAEAVQLVKDAYAKVNAQLSAVVPKPRPMKTTTPHGSSAPTIKEPKTLLEAVQAGLARASS